MPILFRCRRCELLNQVPTATAGQFVDCAGCGEELVVPRPDGRFKVAPPAAVECPGCSRIIELPAEAAGRTIECLGCHQFMVVPTLVPLRPPEEAAPLDTGPFELGYQGLQKGEIIEDPRPRAFRPEDEARISWRAHAEARRASVLGSIQEVGRDPVATWVGWMILVVVGFPWVRFLAPEVLGVRGMVVLHWIYFAVGSAMAFGGASWAVGRASGTGTLSSGMVLRPILTSVVGLVIFFTTDSLSVIHLDPGPGPGAIPLIADRKGQIGIRPPSWPRDATPAQVVEGRKTFDAAAKTQAAEFAQRMAEVRDRLIKTYGEGRTATFKIDGVPDADGFQAVLDALRGRVGGGPENYYATMESSDRMAVLLGPVDNADELAQRLGLGPTYVVQRTPLTISVEWTPGTPPPTVLASGDAPTDSGPIPEVRGATPLPRTEVPASIAPPEAWLVRVPGGATDADAIFSDANPEIVALGDRKVREVWNLRAHERIGELRGVPAVAAHSALSPDGELFATLVHGLARSEQGLAPGVRVWSTRSGAPVFHLEAEIEPSDYLGFAGKSRLVLVSHRDPRVLVFEVPDGRKLTDQALPFGIDWASLRLGLDGRKLAMADRHEDRVVFFDLVDGVVAPHEGEFGDTKPVTYECLGLGFAADGAGLAGVFTDGSRTWLGTWDGQGRRVVEVCTFPAAETLTWRGLVARPWLDGLPGGDWLVRGAAIARQDGRLVALPGGTDEATMFLPRRPIPGGQLAVVEGYAAIAQGIRLVPLPGEREGRAGD